MFSLSIVFKCPICNQKLDVSSGCFACSNLHSFDIAKQGYVNFAAYKKGYSSLSGDSKQMCIDRRKFLSQGFYFPLARLLSETVVSLARNTDVTLIDAGCGEGYYLRCIRDLCPDLNLCLSGFDLSKETIKLASTTEKNSPLDNKISYCVAGIFDMPFFDESCDFIISVFAPISDTESHRVLKSGGYLLVACPGEKHLLGLKEKIYDTARPNEEKVPDYLGFDLIDTKHICYDINIQKEFIPALFGMTPYYWKSSKQTQEAVQNLDFLDTSCDFLLKVYKKKSQKNISRNFFPNLLV